ncbi:MULTISPECIES: carbohydrate ABC transporter permease [unclassified Crossiella]|uniref:carbohydrate ABC transporter permease n=1 Tax=unclassified Crossiella TaxID=2620835 RepID=UPI001FFE7080|nr:MULTISPECIES: sugar ABC transporter permease [unclassified Crossiella]MCK2241440.1 sugar ABC transporter permease [Crossiella sp. S99.2]MCK2255688.1 sugar ABC transporter permease [Crossiella sp. S99.1]
MTVQRNRIRRRDTPVAWLLVAPALLGFGVFFAYPALRGVYLSFTEFHVLTPPKWIGLDNFRQLWRDDVFWNALGITVEFVVLSVLLGVFLSVLTAVMLHRLTQSVLIRGVIILPFLISGVVAALVWQLMLDPQLGIVNVWLRELFGQPVFFFNEGWAIPTLAVINVWKWMGYYAVLVFAGLQAIPPTVYEAGRVDGASELKMFRHLTLPLLRPVLVMVVILNIISAFQIFDIVQVTTKGGPANASNVLNMYIYHKAFSQFDFGYAATMSLTLFAMLIVVTFIQLRLARANESDLD